MGLNRRYAEHYDKLMERRVTEVLIRPKPATLTDAELDTGNDPVVMPKEPMSVRAWARYAETSARIEGRAIAWTRRREHQIVRHPGRHAKGVGVVIRHRQNLGRPTQYELAHRPRTDQLGERITVDAATSNATVTAARAQIPEGNVLLYVRALRADLRSANPHEWPTAH